ncbi:hypothetical protein GYMLUDRAFT_36350 [Collybiopsis luxurians FD-317 M1]|nr:hypothetical protein GYMLUDRAFT_36350 [Collybiopsis luxurians FD-317 M1]
MAPSTIRKTAQAGLEDNPDLNFLGHILTFFCHRNSLAENVHAFSGSNGYCLQTPHRLTPNGTLLEQLTIRNWLQNQFKQLWKPLFRVVTLLPGLLSGRRCMSTVITHERRRRAFTAFDTAFRFLGPPSRAPTTRIMRYWSGRVRESRGPQ